MFTIEWLCCRWPRGPNPQTTPVSTFCVAFLISVVSERRDFKFATQVSNSLWKGREYVNLSSNLFFEFLDPIHISWTAEARVVKFCKQGDYINYCQRDHKSPPPPKGAWLGSCDPFLHAQLWTYKKKICHSTPLKEVNSALDDGPLLLSPYNSRRLLCCTLRL